MGQDLLDYQGLIQEALRTVVRRALEIVSVEGFPGSHHFYITFRTDMPGVQISRVLKDLYPEEMTIVLQYQFRDLEVTEDAFSVSLTFSSVAQSITVPFTAVTAFSDPSVDLGLRFAPPVEPSPSAVAPAKPAAETSDVSDDSDDPDDDQDVSKVLTFDASRKK